MPRIDQIPRSVSFSDPISSVLGEEASSQSTKDPFSTDEFVSGERPGFRIGKSIDARAMTAISTSEEFMLWAVEQVTRSKDFLNDNPTRIDRWALFFNSIRDSLRHTSMNPTELAKALDEVQAMETAL